MVTKFQRRGLLAFIVFLATLGTSNGPLSAQTTTNTTSTFSDWTLQCLNEAGPPPKKTCDIAQTTQVQGKNILFSRVAIEGPVKTRPVKLVVQVPVNVSMRSQVAIETPDAAAKVSAPFDRCVPGGCFAAIELKDETLKKFSTTEAAGKITFTDASGKEVNVPLSFKGFRPAFEALAKE